MSPSTHHAAARAPLYVSIVSNNTETLDGLQAYLDGAGVSSHCTRAVRSVDRVAPPCATAAVVFPDDFAEKDVHALLHQLSHARPRLLVVLVTREPRRFAEREAPRAPLVLPKPSFGWEILDAIRAHAAAHPRHDRRNAE